MTKLSKISTVSLMHYHKFAIRVIVLLTALVTYVVGRIKGERFDDFDVMFDKYAIFFIAFWIVFVVEMIFRFFPSKIESPGCQKQFKRNFKAVEGGEIPKGKWVGTFISATAWFALNGAIAALYFMQIIDIGILVLISLAYSLSDMICILFFCPFQTWFMKNKCCTTCRIYNWDFAMMFTPCILVPHWYSWSLLGISLVLLAVWEISVKVHPERFYEQTNCGISCANCNEKLCHHKTQLRSFIRKNKDTLILKGNTAIGKVKEKIK